MFHAILPDIARSSTPLFVEVYIEYMSGNFKDALE